MKRRQTIAGIIALLMFTHCQSEGGSGEEASLRDTGMTSVVQQAAGTAMRSAVPGEDVRFATEDGIVITGTLYSAGKNAPTVLCLHQWRSDRSSFAGFAKELQTAGITVLTIDMRGYGGSTKTEDGKRIRPERIAGKDIVAAIAFLRGHSSVDAARIGIVGASYGASNAIIYAAKDSQIRAVALLSPGLNYFNELPTRASVKAYGDRPLFAIASSEDVRSVETVQAYASLAPQQVTRIVENAGHGTDIFAAGVGLGQELLTFLKKNL